MRGCFLALECLLLFGLVPFAIFADWVEPPVPLVLGILLAVVYLFAARDFRWREAFVRPWAPQFGSEWKRILVQFAGAVVLTTVLVLLLIPERFLAFPQQAPRIYVMVMFFYPVLSVLPQELLFRGFFHSRYGKLFGRDSGIIVASALAFGWAHVIFNVPEDPLRNPVAVPMTIVGGALFAITYERTKNLWIVCLEHALYGGWIWTVGLGWFFFYSGQQTG